MNFVSCCFLESFRQYCDCLLGHFLPRSWCRMLNFVGVAAKQNLSTPNPGEGLMSTKLRTRGPKDLTNSPNSELRGMNPRKLPYSIKKTMQLSLCRIEGYEPL